MLQFYTSNYVTVCVVLEFTRVEWGLAPRPGQRRRGVVRVHGRACGAGTRADHGARPAPHCRRACGLTEPTPFPGQGRPQVTWGPRIPWQATAAKALQAWALPGHDAHDGVIDGGGTRALTEVDY